MPHQHLHELQEDEDKHRVTHVQLVADSSNKGAATIVCHICDDRVKVKGHKEEQDVPYGKVVTFYLSAQEPGKLHLKEVPVAEAKQKLAQPVQGPRSAECLRGFEFGEVTMYYPAVDEVFAFAKGAVKACIEADPNGHANIITATTYNMLEEWEKFEGKKHKGKYSYPYARPRPHPSA